jgi:hypothetical protein
MADMLTERLLDEVQEGEEVVGGEGPRAVLQPKLQVVGFLGVTKGRKEAA